MAVNGPSVALTRDALRSYAPGSSVAAEGIDPHCGQYPHNHRLSFFDDVVTRLSPRPSHAAHGSNSSKKVAARVEARRARWDLEWHRGMLELFRLGILDALAMPDLAHTDPDATDSEALEAAYGERADPSLVHPWRPANFAAYMEDVCYHSPQLLLRPRSDPNPLTGIVQCGWRERFAHLERLLPMIRALPQVAWNQTEWDAGQEKWRAARRWDEDTELNLGDDASLTSAQESAFLRFQATCEETHLADPAPVFAALQERLAWVRTLPGPVDGIASVDAAVGRVLHSHLALKSPQASSRVSRVSGTSRRTKASNTKAARAPPVEEMRPQPPPTPKEDEPAGCLFNASISSLDHALSMPARSEAFSLFNEGGGRNPIPPRPGDSVFLPHVPDLVTIDPGSRARKISTIAPSHRVVDSFTEVSAYLASASYVASLCGPPLRDMAYGVIIVPAGEEALLLGNWSDHHHHQQQQQQQQHEGAGASEFKREVLQKSRIIKDSMKEQERRMTREERVKARDRRRREEDRAEEQRLDAMRARALSEQRPKSPVVGDDGNVVFVKSEDNFRLDRSDDDVPEKKGEKKGGRASADDLDDVPAVPSAPGSPSPPAPRSPASPARPARGSHETRPSLSLFPRRSNSNRDGARSPLFAARADTPGPQSPGDAPGRPGSSPLQAPAFPFRQPQPSPRLTPVPTLELGGLLRRQSTRGQGLHYAGKDEVVRSEWEREPRRRHLNKAAERIGVALGERGGGIKERLGRLRGRLGLA